MDAELLKTNMLSIAVAGLLIMLTGIALYLFCSSVNMFEEVDDDPANYFPA